MMVCSSHKGMFFNCAMGDGKKCGHLTTSRGLDYCRKCAEELQVCQVCGDKI